MKGYLMSVQIEKDFRFPDPRSARLFACACAELVSENLGPEAIDVINTARAYAGGEALPANRRAALFAAGRLRDKVVAKATVYRNRRGSDDWRHRAHYVAAVYAARAVAATCRHRSDDAARLSALNSALCVSASYGRPIDFSRQTEIYVEILGY